MRKKRKVRIRPLKLNPSLIIHTDGSCKKVRYNGQEMSIGAWYALLEYTNGRTIVLGGNEENTTNNKMELLAAISALEASNIEDEIVLYSDSSYVVNSINKWVKLWARSNWISHTTGEPISNKELMMRLHAILQQRKVKAVWVKGHSNSEKNNYVDRHAQSLADKRKYEILSKYENLDC